MTQPVVIIQTQPAHPANQKSLGVAYLLLLFFGFFGAHQFYMGKTGRGAIYLFTFGLLFIGAFIDLFTLPTQVRRVNAGH